MTPFEIQMLIHYHCSDEPFDRLDSPVGKAAAEKLVKAGILYRRQEGEPITRVTTAMDLYIQALCDVPLPKQIWVMPTSKQ